MPNSEPDTPSTCVADRLLTELVTLRAQLVTATEAWSAPLDLAGPNRPSAENLVHYLALRSRDLRPLQNPLAALGLSSLGRAESHVLATLNAVIAALESLSQSPHPAIAIMRATDFETGEQRVKDHADQLFGPAAAGRNVRIMVTMPSEAADDYRLVLELVRQGMDCMRINCAHDDPARWLRMIDHLRRAEGESGASCRILMDLAGPKLRTGPVAPRPAVQKIRPQRNAVGEVTAPARVWLTSGSIAPPATEADAVIHVSQPWLQALRRNHRIKLRDARGSKRWLSVDEVTETGCVALLEKTAYVTPGLSLVNTDVPASSGVKRAIVGEFPPLEGALRLSAGDLLVLTRDLSPGTSAVLDASGAVAAPARIGCTLERIFDDVKPGEPIWFDDGKIGGTIERVSHRAIEIRITQTGDGEVELAGDKGINLPESSLRTPALTSKDLKDLEFVMKHADMIALSFAGCGADVELLQQHMARFDDVAPPAIVLKIETRRGFEHLPEMLMVAMRAPVCGVMIARGDLAVELGFERLAEVQEEILWICEAAHVPAIWATQVLESLAKRGVPSRAEITDAAMGNRAECVMLNKGPHVVDAVRTLDSILRRMQTHQSKKRAMLRGLRLALSQSAPADRPHGGALICRQDLVGLSA